VSGLLKDRLDKVITDLGLVTSRSQAKSLIEKGDVTVDGKVIRKSAEIVSSDSEIKLTAPTYVGRGAFKLEKALEEFKVSVKDLVMLDIGASTGGFTEVMLLNGASKVYAIDVGHDQLAKKLLDDPRVISMEGTNIRELHSLPELCDMAVMDLSFISITKVLKEVHELLKPGSSLIALVKPQFEAGLDRLPKDGVVKDIVTRETILEEVVSFAVTAGWSHHKTIQSPIEGKTGNIEYLCHFSRS
jgi:23S rRNA (cytidine1920-2'-O)/16S rRNA (cytidine1409-2'-O)-methyltransferase